VKRPHWDYWGKVFGKRKERIRQNYSQKPGFGGLTQRSYWWGGKVGGKFGLGPRLLGYPGLGEGTSQKRQLICGLC